ncbi:hypothetical protein [Candidatus Nephthysia bennettiae]
MTAEQLLNHLLPALAFGSLGLTVKVEHYESPYWERLIDSQDQRR